MNILAIPITGRADVIDFQKRGKKRRLPLGYTKQQNQIYKVAQKRQVGPVGSEKEVIEQLLNGLSRPETPRTAQIILLRKELADE